MFPWIINVLRCLEDCDNFAGLIFIEDIEPNKGPTMSQLRLIAVASRRLKMEKY